MHTKKKKMSKVFIDDEERLKGWLIKNKMNILLVNFLKFEGEYNDLLDEDALFDKEVEINEQMCIQDISNFNLKCVTMKKIPDFINVLCNLVVLELSYNKIKQLPDSLGDLYNLSKLGVSFNKLTHLPDSIVELEKLKFLFCNNNKLKHLPIGFEKLNLKILDISNNEFKWLDESFSDLGSLKDLRLQNNLFDTLPSCVYNLPCLEVLQCSKYGMKKPEPEFKNGFKLLKMNNHSNSRNIIQKTKFDIYKIYRHATKMKIIKLLKELKKYYRFFLFFLIFILFFFKFFFLVFFVVMILIFFFLYYKVTMFLI